MKQGEMGRQLAMGLGLWLVLLVACGPSPRQSCTKYAEKITCIVQTLEPLLRATPNTDPNALTALQSYNAQNFIDRCTQAYQNSSQACKQPLEQLTACADKTVCSASLPCQSELAKVTELVCLPADLLPFGALFTLDDNGKISWLSSPQPAGVDGEGVR